VAALPQMCRVVTCQCCVVAVHAELPATGSRWDKCRYVVRLNWEVRQQRVGMEKGSSGNNYGKTDIHTGWFPTNVVLCGMYAAADIRLYM